jgi:hypothetical protein
MHQLRTDAQPARPRPAAHAVATELADVNVSVYTLLKLLGHQLMLILQRYVDGPALTPDPPRTKLL